MVMPQFGAQYFTSCKVRGCKGTKIKGKKLCQYHLDRLKEISAKYRKAQKFVAPLELTDPNLLPKKPPGK